MLSSPLLIAYVNYPLLPPVYVPLSSHYVSSNTSLFFHLVSVECSGDEITLKECAHDGVGIKDCNEGREEAGVICTCK